MKRYMIMAAICLAAAVACNKQPIPEEGTPAAEPIATYFYDGEEYPVHTAVYAENATSIMVRISPMMPEEDQTTYAVIGIHASLEGTDINVDRAWNNDDYYFIYEDPVKYYSQYRKLQEGTICINREGDTFEVTADIVLPDRVTFQFEYEGPLKPVND